MANMEEMVAEQMAENIATETAVEAVSNQAVQETTKATTNHAATIAKDAGVIAAISVVAVGAWEGGKWLFKKCKTAHENRKAKKKQAAMEEAKQTCEAMANEMGVAFGPDVIEELED